VKAFLKRWWPAIIIGAIVGLIVWRRWPKTVRKITFTDLPVISGGESITSTDSADRERDKDLDTLITDALSDYDHG